MLVNIEDMTMEEYEIWIRGGNSPGLDRLSINEMTMEEYDEMIRRKNGSDKYQPSSTSGDRRGPPEFYADEEDFTDEEEDEDREWEELEMWLTNKIDEDSMYVPFPEKKVHSEETINETSSPTTSLPETTLNHFPESGKLFNKIFSDYSNEFVESEQEMIEETWFDAPVFDEEEDIGLNTTQVGQLTKVLEERLSETIRMEETEEALISGNNFEPFQFLNSNVYDFQVQKEEIKLRANDTTPDLPIMKPSRPRMHKWLREKNADEQVSSQPKHIVEPYCPPIPFPNRLKTRSGNILNSSPFIITNDFVKNVQGIKDDDQELKELERLLENEPVELKVCLTKDPNNKFVGDRELLELEHLMEHVGATFLDERALNQRIDEWVKQRTKTTNEAAENAKEILNSKHIRRMPIKGHTPYAPANTYTPYVNFTYGVYNCCLEKWMLEVDLFLRETREWNDARVKHRNDLIESNKTIFLDDSLKKQKG